MKARLYQLPSLLNKLNSPYSVVLFYGTDDGEINKGFQSVIKFMNIDIHSLNFTRITPENLKKNIFSASDEANTISFLPGHRLITIEDVSTFTKEALLHFTENCQTEALLLIKAGNLSKTSSLRQEAEQNPYVLAFACYPPTEIDLQNNITNLITQAHKSASLDVLRYLTQKLSSNAGVIDQELQKLFLYMGDDTNITKGMIDEIITDSQEVSYDAFCIAVAGGKIADVDRFLCTFNHQNESVSSLIYVLTSYFTTLSKLTENKHSAENKEKILSKDLKANQFKLKDILLAQANQWTPAYTHKVLKELQKSENRTRQTAIPDFLVFAHTCLKITELSKKLCGLS